MAPLRALLAVAVSVSMLATSPSFAGAAEEPSPETLFELEFPAGIAFGYGKTFITERAGRIRVAEGDRLEAEPLAILPTTTGGEAGLLGIAVSPNRGERAVYVFATAVDGQTNQIWRVPVDEGEPEVMIAGLPAGGYHNGGGVAFDRDGMLLVSNGENHESERAQDPSILGGKVYRFTLSGDIPDDNPWPGSPALSIGHRNPFGLTVDPLTGTAWTTENGPDSFDEINRIGVGSNHGWPLLNGPGCDAEPDLDDCADPVLSYPDVIVPTGLAFAPADAPPRWAGHLFFGSYGAAELHDVTLDETRTEAVSDEVLFTENTGIVAVAWGPEGLYYSTPTAVKLIRVEGKTSGGPAPSPDPAAPPASGEDGSVNTTGLALVIVLLLGLFALSRRRLFG